MYVLCSLLTTQETDKEEDWRRSTIFQTGVCCNDQLFSMVIKGGSYTNFMSEDAYRKLGLKTKPHPNPYKVAWINNTNLKVHERCLLTYFISGFVDQVQCDMLPLKVCHILIGRP